MPAAELVLPPLSPVLVGRPYASVPLLAAYAEQRGAEPVRQVNLNQAYVRELFLLAAAEAADGPDGTPMPEADAAETALLAAFPGAVAADPDDAALLAAVARDPAGQSWLFERAGLRQDTGEASGVDVDAYLARLPGLTGMREFLTRHYRAHGVPRVVGVSVPFATQLAPALLLAEVVRELSGGDVFVVLGGPLPSLLLDTQIARILRGGAVDGVVRREGEVSFHQLLRLPSFDPARLRTVSSLCFLDGDTVVTPPPAGSPPKLADTAPRRMDPGYLDGAVELPVMVGRGCFYTCAFCDYIELYEKINFRRAEDVTASATLAAEQSTTGALHFVYEVMSLRYEQRLARFLAAAGLGIRWRGFQRVFGELTAEDVRLLEASGCTRLDIGLESADDDTLRLMDKGYTRAEIGSFLAAFAGSGIQLLINIIVDYPGLTYERAMAAARFLAEATRDIPDVHFEVLRFALGRNSRMYREPERFGLRVLDAPGRELTSPTQVPFRDERAMSEAERDAVEEYYRGLNTAFRQRRADRVARSGVLSCTIPAAPALRDWTVRVEPMVLARSPVIGADSVVVRRMSSGDTFVLPVEYRPLLDACLRAEGPSVELPAFLVEAEPGLRAAGLALPECLEVLADLDMLRPRARQDRRGVHVGISSDANFYRGGVRASSPAVAR